MGERLDVYERKHRWLETAALAVFVSLTAACAWRMAHVPVSVMTIAGLAAWIATDFFSGLVCQKLAFPTTSQYTRLDSVNAA